MRVEDVMTTDVMTVTPETPLKEAARMLVGRGVSGCPVVQNGVVVGVVSETDVVNLERGEFSEGDHRIFRSRDRKRDVQRASARTVGDVMSSPAITVMPIWTVRRRRRAHARQARQPPPRRQGQPARRDRDARGRRARVRTARRGDQARGRRGGGPASRGWCSTTPRSQVTVHGGEAVLTGTVRRRSQAEILPKVAEGVPGVVAVRSELDWSEDDA